MRTGKRGGGCSSATRRLGIHKLVVTAYVPSATDGAVVDTRKNQSKNTNDSHVCYNDAKLSGYLLELNYCTLV